MTKAQTIIKLVKEGRLTPEQAEVMYPTVHKTFGMKLTEHGGVSIRLPRRRFPVTLYTGEWEILLEKAADITGFIAENRVEIANRQRKYFQAKKAA